jgi:hypothetical protein
VRVCFYGTDEEITRICKRPVLALLGPRRTHPVVAFELFNASISTDPYGSVYRLAAELAEIRKEDAGD